MQGVWTGGSLEILAASLAAPQDMKKKREQARFEECHKVTGLPHGQIVTLNCRTSSVLAIFQPNTNSPFLSQK